MSTYRILSMDGGGIRGLLTAVILERLEAAMPGFLAKVDLFAGTSTGGLLALGLAAGRTPAQARELYETQGPLVFADSWLDNLLKLGNALGAQYSLRGLQAALTEVFGEMTLGDLPHKVLIAAFDLDNESSDPSRRRSWKPKFFHNYPCPNPDTAEKVVDVAIRTSVAPTYFPIYQGYIDGGIVAGNPSMCALAQALDPVTGGQNQLDVALLSLSTGRFPRYLTSQDGDWGWVQWARPLVSIVLEGTTDVAHFQCERVLGRRYHRIDPDLPRPIPLDGVDSMPELVSLAEQVDLTRSLEWLERHFR
jgi:uncharacterized protein